MRGEKFEKVKNDPPPIKSKAQKSTRKALFAGRRGLPHTQHNLLTNNGIGTTNLTKPSRIIGLKIGSIQFTSI